MPLFLRKSIHNPWKPRQFPLPPDAFLDAEMQAVPPLPDPLRTDEDLDAELRPPAAKSEGSPGNVARGSDSDGGSPGNVAAESDSDAGSSGSHSDGGSDNDGGSKGSAPGSDSSSSSSSSS